MSPIARMALSRIKMGEALMELSGSKVPNVFKLGSSYLSNDTVMELVDRGAIAPTLERQKVEPGSYRRPWVLTPKGGRMGPRRANGKAPEP